MPSRLLWFAIGFLASEALEALVIIIFVRFFPHKVGDAQRLADAFFRLFANPEAAINARDAEEVYGLWSDDYESGDQEEEEPTLRRRTKKG